MKNKKFNITVIAILLIIIGINAFLDDSLTSTRIEKNLTKIDYDNPLKEIALTLLTGFREILARIIWEKVHQYFHRYEFFERSGVLTFNVQNPDKSTYRQTNIMPWIRIATWLDPNFYEPYLTGSWHLASNLGKYEEAEKLLNELEKNNPDDYVLKYEIANNYYTMHKYEKAIKYTKLALKSEKLIEEFDMIDACRIIKISYEKLNSPQKGIAEVHQILKELEQKYPEDPIWRYKLGRVYFTVLERYDEAVRCMSYAIESEEIKDVEQLITAYSVLQRSYEAVGMPEPAKRAERIIKQLEEMNKEYLEKRKREKLGLE